MLRNVVLPWFYLALVGAYVLAVVLFAHSSGFTWMGRILGASLVLAFCVHAILAHRKIYVSKTYLLWAVWLILAFIPLYAADNVSSSLGRMTTFIQLAAVGFAITNFLVWHGSTRFYGLTLVAGAIASIVFYLLDPVSYTSAGRVSGTLGNANVYGTFLVSAFIFSNVGMLSERALLVRALLGCSSALIFYMILQTGSRQALLGFAISLALIGGAWVLRAGYVSVQRFILGVSALVALGGAALILAVRGDHWSRVEAAMDGEGGTDARIYLIRRAWEVFLESPFVGVGLDNFRWHPDRALPGVWSSDPVGLYSHSTYLEILVGTGLLGFLVYFSVYMLWGRELWRMRRMGRQGSGFFLYVPALALVPFIFVVDFFNVTTWEKFAWLIFPWIVAQLELMRRRGLHDPAS